MLKATRHILILALFSLVLTGADYLGSKQIEKSQNFLGQNLKVTVFYSDLQKEELSSLIDDAFKRAQAIEAKVSMDREGSLVAQINRAGKGTAIRLDEDIFYLIKKGLEVSRLSGGAFDITAEPLNKLWVAAKDKSEPPAKEAVTPALSRVGYDKVLLDNATQTVTLEAEGVQINLDILARGYIMDQVTAYLKDHNVRSAILDFGGSVRLIGLSSEGRAWRVGLEHPRDVNGYAAVLELEDEKALFSSNDYDRFFLFKGKRYPDLFDPRTGYPRDNHVTSVTVIGTNATFASALSAAFFVLGPDEGYAMIEGLIDQRIEAICVEEKPAGKFVLSGSEGAQNMIREIGL